MSIPQVWIHRLRLGVCVAALAPLAAAQTLDGRLYSEMHWRQIGPTRAGRARAVAGSPLQPNLAYIGFDNGGVWKSTDYGSTWKPMFDKESTGSIGAIAVAPSDPNVVYVGSGAGIIRPDLATGDGMYKSTDAGKTWTHLGLRDSQMIADISVDPRNPNRLFVAALGHPYGPNPERGIFRSTDGGAHFDRVLFKDEYTSGNDVHIDPSDPNIVYAGLWQQQQGFSENGAFGGTEGGIYKSTDGGTTWKQLTNGLPPIIEANLAVAPSNTNTIYAMVAGAAPPAARGGAAGAGVGGGGGRGGRGGRGGGATGTVSFYKSTDAGEHWFVAVDDPSLSVAQRRTADNRPLARIGGGDLPTITVDPKHEKVVYSCSTVFWRTEDAGLTWSAVRGAPGGDDYQKTWVNPSNPDIILLVADQGGVISANRGESWSNWYNQPTAAMYHVTADNAFPYRLCGGQQDSGSACVQSRGMDGEITFNDWHPVGIAEYGEAAPDPKNPDLVYGSTRGASVSIYNRRTGQKMSVAVGSNGGGGRRAGRAGAATSQGAASNEPPARSVRTQPISWSPKDPNLLFAATAGVWKSTNGGHSWTAISGDLTRQTWEVPSNTGKYASQVTPAAQGAVTALAPSPLDVNVLWTGSDDGFIQVTTDGGAKWTNVTPPQVKAWTRIFNMDAGHFDTKTAYAAANTMRLDDMNPHFWKTHDGGKTWTEIDKGISGGAVSNSIREDPRKKGLLYAATDTQVWVSFDDGGNWQSLRLNMPAISVRDIAIKDDPSCLCSDLVAGTHGRGFLVLDDVTPLRQAAEAAAATDAFLFKPATALRIRFATNDPTPWPPELPAGENPPPGTSVDYYLLKAADEVKLEFLSGGKVIRTYSSKDPVRNPDPATDPFAYNQLCQQNPMLPDCGLPLYWPAPPSVLRTTEGMHRFQWDMHYDPLPGAGGGGRGGGGGNGAVPNNRTYPGVNAPWVAPGEYTVRLTVNGKSQTQPISVKMDPRVKITPDVQQIFTLTTRAEDNARSAEAAYKDARTLLGKVNARPKSAANDGLAKQLEEIAPAEPAAAGGGGGGRGGRGGGRGGAARGGGAEAPPNLGSIGPELVASVQPMQASEMAPTAAEFEAANREEASYAALMAKWATLKARVSGAAAPAAKPVAKQ